MAAIPPGILTTLVLVINEFADAEADRSASRKTWVILFGFKKTMYVYLALALGCYVVILAGVLFGGWPLWSLLVMITLPLPFMAFRIAVKNIENWTSFLPAVKTTILINFVFSVILSISFVL